MYYPLILGVRVSLPMSTFVCKLSLLRRCVPRPIRALSSPARPNYIVSDKINLSATAQKYALGSAPSNLYFPFARFLISPRIISLQAHRLRAAALPRPNSLMKTTRWDLKFPACSANKKQPKLILKSCICCV